MASEDFETAKKHREDGSWRLPSGFFSRHKPQILFCILVALLAGAAYYSSCVSESTPKSIYSTSLDEAKTKTQTPLLVGINTADAKELNELPGVGPSTADRRTQIEEGLYT